MNYTPNRDNIQKIYYLYCHTNIFNGKKYIGITCKKPEYRWNKGKGYKNNEHFYRAIEKYGWNNFRHEIIKNELTQYEASEFEKIYIELYKTTDCNYGYNKAFGGIDEMSGKYSPHAKEIFMFSKNKEFLRKFECIKDASIYLKITNSDHNISRALRTKTHYAYGYLWSENNTILSTYMNEQRIFQFNKIGNIVNIYDSVSDISPSYGRDKVLECCRHCIKSYKTYIWLYECDLNNVDKYIRLSRYVTYENFFIIQKKLNGEIINCFVSVKEASDLTKCSYQGIYKNCIKELKTSSGFVWEYCDKSFFIGFRVINKGGMPSGRQIC